MDIASLLEVQMTEDQPLVSQNKASSPPPLSIISHLRPSQVVTPEEKSFYREYFNNDFAKVRFTKLHCTACDIHIGSAPSDAYNMFEHPILRVLLCAACRQFYGDGTFEQGDDATDMFCRWCANGGILYCCSYCSNTFCSNCIKRNFEPEIRKKIIDDEKWKCFVCDPKPLYTPRAVCWAILQHIKTLSRILQADRTMNPKEIQSKMEQDDSRCCAGRRPKPAKRKRNDESESDESSTSSTKNSSKSGGTPNLNRSKRMSKSKRRKSMSKDSSIINDHHYVSNGRSLPNHSRFVPYDNRDPNLKMEEDDIAPLLNCEQTMIEGDQDSIILPSSGIGKSSKSKTPISHFIDGASSLHAIPTQNLMQPINRHGKTLIPIRPLRRISSLPPGTNPQMVTRLPSNFPLRPQNAPMVTLPVRPNLNSNSGVQPRARLFQNIQTEKSKTNKKPIPSVINLESDTEEPPNNTEKSEDDGIIELESLDTVESGNQEAINIIPGSTVRTFDQEIKNPIKSIDILLKKLRCRLKREINNFEGYTDGNDIHNSRIKLKMINRNIDRVVTELAGFNNQMIRKYKPWKESQITGKSINTSTSRIILDKKNKEIISLDMECIDESESEEIEIDEDNSHEDDCIIDFSRKLSIFTEKDTVNQGCNTKIETEDKGVQVYGTISTDYDMSIGYSLLMRADYDYNKKTEVLKPVVIHDEFFGKYEEQFINYLQSCEDNLLVSEEEKENTSPEGGMGDKTLKDLIDADITVKCPKDNQKNDNLIEDINIIENELNDTNNDSNSLSDKIISLDNSKESDKIIILECLEDDEIVMEEENDEEKSIEIEETEMAEKEDEVMSIEFEETNEKEDEAELTEIEEIAMEEEKDETESAQEKETGIEEEKNEAKSAQEKETFAEKLTNSVEESDLEVITGLIEIPIVDTEISISERTSTPLNNSESIENGAEANSSPSKHKETVKVPIEDSVVIENLEDSPVKEWKNNDDDDECTIID